MKADSTFFSETLQISDIEKLLEQWQGLYPKMGVLAFLPEADREKVPLLQQLFFRKNIPLTGAVFPALVARDQFYNHGLLLLRFNEMPYAALYSPLNDGPDPLSKKIGEMADGVRSNLEKDVDTTLFMIFDAMVPNIATILDHLYLILADRVHYMGVNAGSETFKPMPCLFDSKNILQDGVLLILMKNHSGAILEHGYCAPSQMISATATQGNRIISIDWRPAFEVYQEMAKAHYGVTVNKENFYQNAVHFPFGIVRANNEILVRIPVALEEDGSLFCVGEVPPNSVLTLLHAPEVDLAQTVKTLTEGLVSLSGPTKGKEILTFYCAGRKLHIGDQATSELVELREHTQASQIMGALSLGEIGSSIQWGYPLFHNATLVCSVWGTE